MSSRVTTRLRRSGALTAVALGALAAPAAAEPSATATLSASQTSYAFEGSGSGFNKAEALALTPCGSPNRDCQDILVKLEVGGTLSFEVKDPDEGDDTGNTRDLDLRLFESDSSGKEGKQLASAETESANEKLKKTGLKEGFYLARIEVYRGLDLHYTGRLDLLPAVTAPAPAAPAPVTQPAPQPAPQSKPAARKKPSCKRKAAKIKNKKKRKAAIKRCGKKKR